MNLSRSLLSVLAGMLLAAGSVGAAPTAAIPEFADWPAGTSPAEVGKRIAENFAARNFQWQTETRRRYVIYPEICAWYGSLTVAGLIGDADLRDRLYAKYDILLTPEGAARVSPDAHVDYRIFGVVPLEFSLQGRGDAWRAIGLTYADAQWGNPVIVEGVSAEARWWIDDMYMLPILQVQAYRASKQAKYLDRAALTMAAYLDKLQQPTGLFLHAPDSPFYWGRGNGWVAAGMAELLRDLPESHPHHARILAGYRAMMAALLQAQGTDGLWKQLVDKPESWGETSGSAMFAFAIVTGVKHGWLDTKAYAPAARRAWLALVAHLDADANLGEVCIGTDKAQKATKSEDLKVQYDFYQARPRRSGDLHGQSPMLWTASALLR
ncbi:glycosyl hydrolase [Oleiharenicola lentus]|uniref:Glycosyl hydrolase n=1 Tax=Oleiharenicola lentus TaxID=2508720 RepID=A0A4Q1C6P1_9BACT|nr:glycoside hydrolase family 88 protein [Oleiharenicola lentus]RXK54557.1 glycosyl hydrolase [Oleiharenicola lentus]